LNKKKFKDLGLYLAHVLDLAPNKDFRLTSNKKLLAINIDKINPKSLQNIKKRFGIDLKQKAKEPIRLKSKSGMGKISHLGMESVNEAAMELNKIKDAILMFQKKIKKQGRVTNARDEDHLKNLIKVYKQMGGKGVKESVNEAKKMRFDKDGNRIIPKRTWLRMPDYAKMKKNGKDYVLSIDPKNKKRSVYLPAVIESVNEGQKKQASMILRKFDMAYIKLVDRSTGSKVDGKIIEKAYEKGLIPLNKIMIEWDRGQQENPGLSEDETLEGLGDKFGKKLDKYNKKNKKSKDALKKYAKLKKK
jgi:hypothetical protein